MGKKGKAARASRKERKVAEKAARAEAARLAEVASRKRKRWLIVIPVLTGVAAFVAWQVLDDTKLVGVTALIGGLLFLMVALAGLGAGVKPRDRLKSGAIDFGKKD